MSASGRPRLLLTGGSGLLALNWACSVRANWDVVLATHVRGVDLRGTTAVRLPLDDAEALTREAERIRPDVIVHTAGVTSVEACERDPEGARHVYETLSRNVAQAAVRVGARLIHISTDHLFRGTRSMYSETAPADPVNAYGRAKLLAECAVAEACPAALTVRTNFFGWGHRFRQSFSDWIYYALSERRPITLFDDVFVTPILVDRLVDCAHRLLDGGATGVYNVVGDERLSKWDFGVRLARVFGLPESLIQRGKIAVSQLSVERPPDMSLDNAKARAVLNTSLGTIDEFLQLLREQDLAGRRRELLAAVTE